MAEWATVADVRARWHGEDDEFTDDIVTVLIADAEDIATHQLPELPRWVAEEKVSKQTVRRVIARMVLRFLRNPEGVRSITDSTGPHTGSTTYAGDHPGELVMTDEDRKELTPGGQSSGRRAFSVMPNYRR